MRFNALRSSVARLFETTATLVAPKTEPSTDRTADKQDVWGQAHAMLDRYLDGIKPGIECPGAEAELREADPIPDKLMEDIEDMVRKAVPGADVMVRRVDAQGRPPNPALKDIFDDAIKSPPEDNFPWETWARIRDERPIPHGWAYCRIANRFNMASKGLPDTCKFTFGIVRGTFGLWSKPYSVCSFDFEAGSTPNHEKAERVLFSVCHLPSGTNMGLFFDINLAAEACELMDKTRTDWSHIDQNDPMAWGGFFNQMVTLWAHVGIQQSISHAHNLDGEGPAMVIFERTPETMAMFRPLVLS